MQKLVKEYFNDLKRQRRRRRRAGIAVLLLAVLVVGGVAGILTQYGMAMTGDAKCGMEEHQHDEFCYEEMLVCGQEEGESHAHGEGCYTLETALTCGLEEGGGHVHGDACYETVTETTGNIICGQEESPATEGTEGHTHGDDCYGEDGALTCGQEEAPVVEATEGHTHGDDCYEKTETSRLICTQEEGGSHTHEDACYTETRTLTCTLEETEGHVHGKDCYEEQLICEKEEHMHTEECFIDADADVESKSDWDSQYADVEWKDAWGEDLVTAARMQLGYKESDENYMVAQDGSHKGYTRYGDFAGDRYMDWDAAFVNFCMYYAGLEGAGVFTDETDSSQWTGDFIDADEKNEEYLTGPEGYTPELGDIVLLEKEGEETGQQMGIVSSYDETTNEIQVIQGNSGDEVEENTYDAADQDIVSYVKISELEDSVKDQEEETEEEPVEEEPTQEEILAAEQVEAVIELIEALPAPEEIMEKFASLEDAQDEEGYDAYYLELYEQVMEAYAAYEALTEEQKAAVTNKEKLLQYEWLLTDTMDGTEHVWEEMKPDEAYINELTVTSIKTGTAPFDETEGRGNDTTADDKIVRTCSGQAFL